MPDVILSDIVLYLVSGVVLGYLIGLTGIGGGVLTVPFLLLVIKLEPIAAVGTAGLYGVLTKIWAAVRHYRQGTVNVDVGVRFFLASVPGILVGSLAVKWSRVSLSPSGVETLQDVVSYMVMASICFALVALLFDYDRLDTRFLSSRRGAVVKFPCLFLVGAVMGMTSIGGGILIIPSLLLFYRETSRYVGTSIFVALLLMTVMSVSLRVHRPGSGSHRRGSHRRRVHVRRVPGRGPLRRRPVQAHAPQAAPGRGGRSDRACDGDDGGGPVLVEI